MSGSVNGSGPAKTGASAAWGTPNDAEALVVTEADGTERIDHSASARKNLEVGLRKIAGFGVTGAVAGGAATGITSALSAAGAPLFGSVLSTVLVGPAVAVLGLLGIGSGLHILGGLGDLGQAAYHAAMHGLGAGFRGKQIPTEAEPDSVLP
ncbi:MAG: hypothetical protein D6776_12180 [Planctomycetota bacterium]|nr:MAG: hypothetical protein D6776_12180 [Planctomycetota bacterium]